MLRRIWRDHVEQAGLVGRAEMRDMTRASVLLLVLGSTLAVNLLLGYFEPARALTGYRYPFLPVLLMAVGLWFSHLLHGAVEDPAGSLDRIALFTALDTAFIAASLVSMGLCASHPANCVMASLSLAVAVLWGVEQGFSWPTFGAAAVLPAALTAALDWRDPLHVVLVGLTPCFYVVPAALARRRFQSRRDAAEATRRRLAEEGRLATLGRVGASLAHEMNQPLVAIRGFAQRLRRKGLQGSSEELGAIALASSQLERLVGQMQLLASPQPAKLEPLDPAAPIEDALLLMRAQLENRGVEVRFAPPAARLPRVRADRQRLGQLVVNLLVNARDALDVLPEGAPRSLHIGLEASDGHVSLEVADSGPGVPPDAEPHLFDPFFTTKDRSRGAGLGLAISREIAEQHGGTLAFERPAGGGARFRLTLPAPEDGG